MLLKTTFSQWLAGVLIICVCIFEKALHQPWIVQQCFWYFLLYQQTYNGSQIKFSATSWKIKILSNTLTGNAHFTINFSKNLTSNIFLFAWRASVTHVFRAFLEISWTQWYNERHREETDVLQVRYWKIRMMEKKITIHV